MSTITLQVQFFTTQSDRSLIHPPNREQYRQFSALSDRNERQEPEALQTVILDPSNLFANQFNTMKTDTDSGRRLFDWYTPLKIFASGKVGAAGWGHWLTPESRVILDELRARRHTCGFCGYQTDEPQGAYCPKCVGSAYLEPKDLYLLQLLPVIPEPKRSPHEVPSELLEQYNRLKADYASRQGERLQAERAKFLERQVKEHADIDRKTKIYSAIYDCGLDPSKTGAVYYNHTDSVQFGAIARLTDEQAAEIQEKATAGKIPCAWTIKRS